MSNIDTESTNLHFENCKWSEMKSRIFAYLDENNIKIEDPIEEHERQFKKLHRSGSPVMDATK